MLSKAYHEFCLVDENALESILCRIRCFQERYSLRVRHSRLIRRLGQGLAERRTKKRRPRRRSPIGCGRPYCVCGVSMPSSRPICEREAQSVRNLGYANKGSCRVAAHAPGTRQQGRWGEGRRLLGWVACLYRAAARYPHPRRRSFDLAFALATELPALRRLNSHSEAESHRLLCRLEAAFPDN
jgi:hypothetical protein